jgi:branched-chain amino acid transport system ATP-binding protein
VLQDLSLDVNTGDLVRVSGPNGGGKSTLFNAIAGLLPLIEGQIFFQGVDLKRLHAHERSALGISYMRQRDNVFPSLNVRQNLELAGGATAYDFFQTKFPDWAADLHKDKGAGMLSGGQKQKLAWAMCTLHNPPLVLADEPFAGMEANFQTLLPLLTTAIYIEHN